MDSELDTELLDDTGIFSEVDASYAEEPMQEGKGEVTIVAED